MKKIIVILILVFSPSVLSEAEIQGTLSELKKHIEDIPKMVTINLTATKNVSSNKAIIKLLVETESKTLADALKANSRTRTNIRNQLKTSSIELKNIRESKFSSTPEYGFFGEQPESFKVSNIVSVIVLSEEQMIVVAGISDQNKNIRYLSSESQIQDKDKKSLETGLLAQALSDIKDKAAIYEKELTVKLSPVSFNVSSFDIVPQQQQYYTQSKRSKYSSSLPSRSSFGEVNFTLTISVQYKLE